MHSLNIKLNQEYKSFENSFNCNLEGDLIIMSGVNGSGKSQLMNIIKQEEKTNNTNISSEITLNGVNVKRGDILYRSLKENLNIPNLTQSNPQNITNYKNTIWSHYRRNKLNLENNELKNFQHSAKLAKEILIETYGEEKFQKLNQAEINNKIPNYFVWKPDDIFTNFIGDVFFNYASKRHDLIINNYDNKIHNENINFEQKIGKAPWEEFNNLFGKLKLEYRFKNNYKIKTSQISEQPQLYGLNSNGNIDGNQPRNLNDLSDGEKSIISFIFGSLSDVKKEDTRIILLDEFDATFNPSLTEMFYTVLEEYFLKKGILVIIVTHSPTTISLAPDNASFYEVFKNNSLKRIEKAGKEHYEELRIANKYFYTKIGNQENRIKELMDKNNKIPELEKKLLQLEKENTPLIMTEGKTDWKHLKNALSKINVNIDINFYEFENEIGESLLMNYCIVASSGKNRTTPLICIFDRDTKFLKDIETAGNFKYQGNNVFSFAIPEIETRDFKNICIEHYYSNQDLKTKDEAGKRLFLGTEFFKNGNSKDKKYQTKMLNKCKKNGIIDSCVYSLNKDLEHKNNLALSKNDFANNILNGEKGFINLDLSNFEKIFKIINSIIINQKQKIKC